MVHSAIKKKNHICFTTIKEKKQYIHLKDPKPSIFIIWSNCNERCGSAWLDVVRFNYIIV